MTDTTNTATEAGVVAHGFRALAEHFAARGLSAPLGVDIRPTHLSVRIPSQGAEAWAASIADGDGIQCLGSTSGSSYFHTSGLLPDTGVRVRLTWARAASWAVPA